MSELGSLQLIFLISTDNILTAKMFKLDLEKAEEPDRDQVANIHRIIKKAREFQKNIYLCFID